MFRSTLLGVVLAGGLAFQVSAADVVVKIAPPHAIVEKRGEPPEAGFVWIDGYHRWDGNAYVWVPGRWEKPPRPHAVWVAHKWVKRGGGYVLVEGRWK
jgi:hypothetical protein